MSETNVTDDSQVHTLDAAHQAVMAVALIGRELRTVERQIRHQLVTQIRNKAAVLEQNGLYVAAELVKVMLDEWTGGWPKR